MITLECVEGPYSGKVFEFAKPSIVLGRGEDCDIRVDDSTCSRKHAMIVERDGAHVLTDLGSTNGVRLDGAKVKERTLSSGDRFFLGKNGFVFRRTAETDSAELASGLEQTLEETIDNTVTLQAVETFLLNPTALREHGSVSREELDRLQKTNRQMQAIYSLSRAINSTLELEDLYRLIADSVFSNFNAAERVCIFIVDKRDQKFQLVRSQSKRNRPELPVSRAVLERVRRTPAGILATDAQSDARFESSQTLINCSVRSFMCVPLTTRERTLGAVYVENRSQAECFEESDLELLTVFGNQMARAIENASLYEELERSFYETVRSLLKAIEAKDEYTRGHSDRVALYAVGIGRILGLSKRRVDHLKTAAELHDIGKIAIPEGIINSALGLTDDEFEVIKKHPDFGVEILRPIRFLEPVLPAVRYHHERYNGGGYPEGRSGEQIPLEARILNLADAFDAMTTTRSYNDPISLPDALARCRSEAGISFDATCVEALCQYIEERFCIKASEPHGSFASTPDSSDDPEEEVVDMSQTSAFDEEKILQEISDRTGTSLGLPHRDRETESEPG